MVFIENIFPGVTEGDAYTGEHFGSMAGLEDADDAGDINCPLFKSLLTLFFHSL